MKSDDLTPSAKKAYKRHLKLSEKLFRSGKEAGKVDPNAILYTDVTDKPDDTYASAIYIGKQKKDKYISYGSGYLKGPHQEFVSKHEVGHILAGHVKPYSTIGHAELKEMGDWESVIREEIEANIAGYGGPSKLPPYSIYYIKWYLDDFVPEDQSWPLAKKMLREYGVPFKLLHKAEEKYGLKD